MVLKHLLQHTFLLFYLALLSAGFLYTVFRISTPGIPWPVLRFIHGTMAPYQGGTAYNQDLLAEGKIGSTWKTIDLDKYYPMIRGNQIMMRRLRRFEWESETLWKEKYGDLAALIKKHEDVDAVRLTWQTWPRSVDGWDGMRTSNDITNYFLAETP